MKSPSNNLIALLLAMFGSAVTIYVFAESRNDPGLRMAALVSATSLAAALIAIASTLLTGKDLTNRTDPSALPPGSVSSESSVVQTPPITAPVTTPLPQPATTPLAPPTSTQAKP